MSKNLYKKQKTFLRFTIAQRVEHLIMLLSFATLGLTGIPQKFPLAGISIWFVNLLGGIESLRVIHHTAAIVMMLGTIYHLLMMGYKIFVRRVRMTMLPTLQDIKDAIQALKYNLGISKTYPQMGRYTFEEKVEYWAFVWGTIIMGITGFIMWNPITTAKYLPGEIIPAAKAAHGGEALLAVLAIIIWHLYGVHIKRFNKSMWTGRLTEEEMLHEHPLELADLKAGTAERPVDEKILRKRQLVYIPIAIVLAGVMLLGVYGFVFYEQTAQVPNQPISTAPVYVPFTPTAIPTPIPSGEQVSNDMPLTWEDSIGPFLQSKCGACHGTAGGFSLGSYTDAIQGGTSGAVIIPNDLASPILVLQSAGGHPGQLTVEELSLVQQWIENGAPEQ